MYNLAVHELAVRALASGGHGGHGGRRIIILVLLLIIVAVIVGWVLHARRNRGRS